MFQYRVDQYDGQPRLMQRTVIPDGIGRIMEISFREDFARLNLYGPNVSPSGLYGVGAAKGQGTGADPVDENDVAIPYEVYLLGTETTWIFDTPPMKMFKIWVEMLVDAGIPKEATERKQQNAKS
jgi:hypothetical protein